VRRLRSGRQHHPVLDRHARVARTVQKVVAQLFFANKVIDAAGAANRATTCWQATAINGCEAPAGWRSVGSDRDQWWAVTSVTISAYVSPLIYAVRGWIGWVLAGRCSNALPASKPLCRRRVGADFRARKSGEVGHVGVRRTALSRSQERTMGP